MNTDAELSSLLEAILRSGRVPPEQKDLVERLFAEHAADLLRLADELLAVKLITKYMHRKLQTGRPGELVFGQYLILERIGEGGMGKVYRAVETGLHQGREVALKTIRPNLLTNKTVVQRYKREARAAASLHHPNVVELYNADDVGGRYFLAMEFVDGSDLSRLVKDLTKDKVSMPPGEAAEYIRQAALGLQQAHDMGLVHRDIKPSNLLVTGERAIPGTGGRANVKILDMGLVRSLADDDTSTTDLTRDGTVVGTPDYMSPEQSRDSRTVDARADIYSLGCTLFYLLRGLPPYDTGTAIDKLIKHQLDPIPDIRQYRPDVPPALAAVIRKMMSKKPTERFQTAAEVAAELAQYTGELAFDFSALPSIPGLDDIPSLDAAAPAPKSGTAFPAFDLSGGAATPAPVFTPAAAVVPPAGPVPLPAAPVLASESGARSLPRPLVRPVAPVVASPASPPTGQRSVRVVAVQSKPIAKRPADATPSGDLDTPSRTRRAESTESEPTSRRARRPAAKKPKGGFPVVAVAVAGVAGVALIVVLAVIISLAGKNDKPTATTAPPPTTPATTPKPEVKSPFRPVADLLPDDTTAVLVGDPKRVWELALADADSAQNTRRTTDLLARWFRFDVKKFDRVTVCFHADMSRCVAAGEGDVLKGDGFRKELDRMPLVETESGPNGVVLVKNKPAVKENPFNSSRRVRGALLPAPAAYLIGSDKTDLAEVYKNASTRKGPTGVDLSLMAAVTDATKGEPPLLYFAASGGCRLPLKLKGTAEPLSSAGVDLLTLSVANADGGQARLTLTLVGSDTRKLEKFLEHELPGMLEAVAGQQLAKPLANPVAEAVQSAQRADAVNGRKQLTATFTWPWAAVPPVVEKLMPGER